MKDGYVLLCPNAHRDHGLASTLAIAGALREHGHEVRISPFLSDGLENTWPRDIPTAALPIALPGARLVVPDCSSREPPQAAPARVPGSFMRPHDGQRRTRMGGGFSPRQRPPFLQ